MFEMVLGVGVPSTGQLLLIAALFVGAMALFAVFVALKWGAYWVQAYMSGADVTMASLITMTFLKIQHRLIVNAKVMACQAGLRIDRADGMSTARLQAHHLAGGDVMNVVQAIIAAQRAGINLDFDQAAAIDLAGRDVLRAVQTSVSPRVIHCPSDTGNAAETLSAVAKNGVELRVGARVTVRTNLEQLIGGATEETIIARVGQGIITAIGSADSHMDVLAMPSQISQRAMAHGLDANTAFAIVSIDILDIDVGENIGARLQIDQAQADTRVARASAEVRRAKAVARVQQMKAKVTQRRAELVRAEAKVPEALAHAFRVGQIQAKQPPRPRSVSGGGPQSPPSKIDPGPRNPQDDAGKRAKPFPRSKGEE